MSMEKLEKHKCVRCSNTVSTKGGRCKSCLKKLRIAKKTPGSAQRAQTKADDALRRQDGKNGTASKKSSGRGNRKSIVKQIQSAEKKTGQKLSPDRKDNSRGYAASNTRAVPEKLNRGRHKVDSKKLANWRKRMKKMMIEFDEELIKEQYDLSGTGKMRSDLNTLHGWISPKGEFHAMKPNENHNAFLMGIQGKPGDWNDEYDHPDDYDTTPGHKEGWIGVGHSGENSIRGHTDILNNPNHPATATLRKLVSEHWSGKPMEIVSYKDKEKLAENESHLDIHDNLNTGVFRKYGLQGALKHKKMNKSITPDDFLTLLRAHAIDNGNDELEKALEINGLELIKAILNS